jgi:hypothetical protein
MVCIPLTKKQSIMENQNPGYILTEIGNAKPSWTELTESQR